MKINPEYLQSTFLQSLLEKNDFFGMARYLSTATGQDEESVLYYSSWLLNAMNRPGESNLKIRDYISKYASVTSAEVIAELLKLETDNYFKLGDYTAAARKCRTVTDNYASFLNETETFGMTNLLLLLDMLSGVPAQKIRKFTRRKFPIGRDSLGYINIKVSRGNRKDIFMMDTGANLSAITESAATGMGLKITGQKMNVATSTHIKVESRIAVAEEIKIGGAVFENVVFMVMPDEYLRFEKAGYAASGIIGMPVLEQFGRMEVYKDCVIVPKKRSVSGPNMFFDGMTPVVAAGFEDRQLHLILDTGACLSELTGAFIRNSPHLKESELEKQTISRGGAGGTFDTDVYLYRDFRATIAAMEISPDLIFINPNPHPVLSDKDGILGMDILSGFRRITIDFRDMFLDLA